LIVLSGTEPLVWRRILVPTRYTFWDLHVAIQDAMGWTDHHLHEFEVAGPDPGAAPLRIGIPDEEFLEPTPLLAGWELKVERLFQHQKVARYHYDFGDDWIHAVVHEGFAWPAPRMKLPACIGGACACPPEDCGGLSGYERFLEILANPQHPEYHETLQWAGGSWDRDRFDPAAVKFDDPKVRWRIAFEEEA